MHCTHVTNNGASKLTLSPLNSALFTKTVMIDVNLIYASKNQKKICNKLERKHFQLQYLISTVSYQYKATTPNILTYFENKDSLNSFIDITIFYSYYVQT